MSGNFAISILGLVVFALVLVIPLVLGIMLIVWSRRRGPGHAACGGCGYNVSATLGTAARCPECGKDFAVVGVTPPTGQRNPTMLWAGVIVLLVPFMCGGLGLLTATMSHYRATTAQRAAIATQQALAAQQQALAQANAIKPIPAPLTSQQIAAMSVDEASAAIALISAARTRTDLTDDDRTRLAREATELTARMLQP